jgi:hypothetical protein
MTPCACRRGAGALPYVAAATGTWLGDSQVLISPCALTNVASDRRVDFLIDDETWEIRYFIIARRSWWPGKHVLLAPEWIQRVSWEKSKVHVDLSRVQIRRSPVYSANMPLTRDDEIRLHRHYRREGYWNDDPEFVAHDP